MLDSLSINNIFKNLNDNSLQIKENNKDTLQFSNNFNINNINCNNPNNFSSSNNIKSSLFNPQNNNIGLRNNYIYQNFPPLIPNSKNDLFINQIPNNPSFPSNLNMNTFYTGPKVIQNNFGNEKINSINNLEMTNVPFFQMSIQNPIAPSSLKDPNSISNTIPNNFLINNNTNINTHSKNIGKNINNIKNINLDNKNIIKNNLNNFGNINPKNESINNNSKYENSNNIKTLNMKDKTIENNKIKFTSKIYDNNNILKLKAQKNTPSSENPKKTHLIFNIKEVSSSKQKVQKEQLNSKKRKRSLKNNKLVFLQLDKGKEGNEVNNEKEESEVDEENKNNESLNSEKMSELINKNTKPRGSRYRGVSKNGSQWQVLIMVKKKKRYLGSFSNEEEAARAYDKVALQHHGIKAKTNYDYTKEEVEKIMVAPKLLKLE